MWPVARRLRQMTALRGLAFTGLAAMRAVWVRTVPHWLAHLERHEIIAVPTRCWSTLPAVAPAGLTVARIDAGTVGRAPAGIAAFLDHPAGRAQLASGDTAYVCQHRGEYAGSTWVAMGAFVQPFTSGLRVRFVLEEPGRTAWDYDLQISPRYRLTPVLNLLWRTMLRDLDERGVEWSLSSISVFNAYSRHVHDRLQPVRLGQVLGARVLGATICLDGEGSRIPRSRTGEFEVLVRSRHLSPSAAIHHRPATDLAAGRLLGLSGIGTTLPELLEAALAAVC
jgi:hypothetical protein